MHQHNDILQTFKIERQSIKIGLISPMNPAYFSQ
ncbi:hypothetical protein T02_2797 [Trichinella nativa]|uniref:Uncharacterized protein n=1 Tax=Trichinella nativa TaxID=6335 RepID=A0A0V1KI51_9BILA|nr:hypothetical protein T02_2797 [Trichinella nativa]